MTTETPCTMHSLHVLGTPLQITDYAGFAAHCHWLRSQNKTFAVDFTNTQVVTMRRHELPFRKITSRFDYFIPDGMPLIWCLNLQGAKLRDRVYGPTFMRYFMVNAPPTATHYFLGGSETCLDKLKATLLGKNPQLRIVGSRTGYFKPEEESQIVAEINQLSADFIWVGLGTPKQQDWIHRNKSLINRGVLFAVGFAFDVNAGTKPDAPLWLQKRGLTWVFRLFNEPRRLGARYLRYNSLFLFYLFWDGLRGKAFLTEPPPG